MNNSKAIRRSKSSTRSWTKWMRAKHVKINHCYKQQKYDCAKNLQLRKTKLANMLEPLSLICSCLNKAIKQVHLVVTEHTKYTCQVNSQYWNHWRVLVSWYNDGWCSIFAQQNICTELRSRFTFSKTRPLPHFDRFYQHK